MIHGRDLFESYSEWLCYLLYFAIYYLSQVWKLKGDRKVNDILLDFPDNVCRILKYLIESEDCEQSLYQEGNNFVIECIHETCFSWKMTLVNASCLPEQVEHGCIFWCNDVAQEGERYLLKGGVELPDSDEAREIELWFTDISLEFVVHHAKVTMPCLKPWFGLAVLAGGILCKAEVAPQLMNDQELALVPLLNEIYDLVYGSFTPVLDYPILRQRLDFKLLVLLDRVVSARDNWKKHMNARTTLLAQLNKSRHESIWRNIFDEIQSSQADYPVWHCIQEETRKKIEHNMHARGYKGIYPDFRKTGEIRGLHVQDANGLSYLVCNEKHAVFHIHCQEYIGAHGKMAEFLCGTELLKNGEQPGDIWSCMFDAKGRRLIHSISSFGEEELFAKLELAIKKAELQKLTKSERKALGSVNALKLFLSVLLVAGGFFGIFWTIGFGLLIILITGLLEGWSAVPEMCRIMPWGLMIILAWAGFGGAMGLITVLAERNR